MILKAILLAVCSFFLMIACHAIAARWRTPARGQGQRVKELLAHSRLVMVFFLCTAALYSVFFFAAGLFPFFHCGQWLAFFLGMALFLTLAFAYLTLYYLFDRSVSATLLEHIDRAPGNQLSREEVFALYKEEEKYDSELQGMVEGGFVVNNRGFYYNTPKGRVYGRLARWVKRFFKLGAGG